MKVKSVKRPGVLGALLTLLSPKGSVHVRRLIVALLTPPDLLATRLVGADSAQRPALATADSEKRLMKNLQFVSMALLAACLMLVHRTTSAQVVTTVAGSGGRGSVDGSGAKASFSGPSGLAVDSSGNVADSGSHKIRKITPSGTVTTLAGSGNVGSADGRGTAASFRFPSSVSVDNSGNVHVTEESFWFCGGGSDADLRRITPDGEVTTVRPRRPYVMSEVGVAVPQQPVKEVKMATNFPP